ncbi:MAG TPA: hypothetical protein VK168_18950 [Saprospiraceae bacterium]|nr:hypothetical protein [Saprospiraceae bacterium]
MQNEARITAILEELKDFFDRHKVNGWSGRAQHAIQQINEGNLNISIILNDFVGAGMGSLIDLYICSNNGHQLVSSEDETNKQLQRLTEQLLIIKGGLDRGKTSKF